MTSLQLMMQLIIFSTVALGIVYFLFYRPTIEAQRKARRTISDLQVGDEVVTTSGFFGRVVSVTEPDEGPAVIGLDLGGITVRARVTAIAELLPRPEPAAPEAAATQAVANDETAVGVSVEAEGVAGAGARRRSAAGRHLGAGAE